MADIGSVPFGNTSVGTVTAATEGPPPVILPDFAFAVGTGNAPPRSAITAEMSIKLLDRDGFIITFSFSDRYDNPMNETFKQAEKFPRFSSRIAVDNTIPCDYNTVRLCPGSSSLGRLLVSRLPRFPAYRKGPVSQRRLRDHQ